MIQNIDVISKSRTLQLNDKSKEHTSILRLAVPNGEIPPTWFAHNGCNYNIFR